jgi:hypothetical protein
MSKDPYTPYIFFIEEKELKRDNPDYDKLRSYQLRESILPGASMSSCLGTSQEGRVYYSVPLSELSTVVQGLFSAMEKGATIQIRSLTKDCLPEDLQREWQWCIDKLLERTGQRV